MGTQNGEEITVIIHGTFANPSYRKEAGESSEDDPVKWWLQGSGGQQSIADLLDEALDDDRGSVWHPSELDKDDQDKLLPYEDVVEWSGKNTHKARVKAAKELAESLDLLAEGRGCDAENQLNVNYVAHSHGGNVVLESLRRNSDKVKPRQICMLGTPLTWRFTDLRVLYLPYVFLFGIFGIWVQGQNTAAPGMPSDAMEWWGVILMAPIILWLSVASLQLARYFSGVFGGRPAYGPKRTKLQETLDRRPAALFISNEDEADLMMHLGAAPMDAYRALVKGQPKIKAGKNPFTWFIRALLRLTELLVVRPIAYLFLIPLLEILLERFGLGFPFRSVLVRNYEMVTWSGRNTYSAQQIVRHEVPDEDLKSNVVKVELTHPSIPAAVRKDRGLGTELNKERIKELRSTLKDTAKGLQEQIRLRHSAYYESDAIIEQVAKVINAENVREPVAVAAVSEIDLRGSDSAPSSTPQNEPELESTTGHASPV